jgi:hypothetical protein
LLVGIVEQREFQSQVLFGALQNHFITIDAIETRG